MRNIVLAILISIYSLNAYSQKKGESEIIVILSDTAHAYEKVKFAFIKWDFKIQNDFNKDTIRTKARGIYNPSGYLIGQAIIVGKTVFLSGWYKDLRYGLKEIEGTKNINLKTYKRITYFKNSSTWRLLNNVAEELKKEVFKYEDIKINEPQSKQPIKTKEERLRELKDLFQKELITKEEYERAKQKILEEQ